MLHFYFNPHTLIGFCLVLAIRFCAGFTSSGEEKSYVDFFLAQNWDWAHECFLTALQEKTGKDYFAAFPKIKAVAAGIQALASYKDLTGTPVEGMFTNRAEKFKDFSVNPEVLEAYGPDSE